MCLTANDLYALHGRTPHEMVTGNTPDISEYTEFKWYEPIFYYDDTPFPEPKCILARWLGVAHRVGQAPCYWILTKTGKVIARTTIQKMNSDDSMIMLAEIKEFDAAIHARFHDDIYISVDPDSNTNVYLQDLYDADAISRPFDNDAMAQT
jgi:hypothetical protein